MSNLKPDIKKQVSIIKYNGHSLIRSIRSYSSVTKLYPSYKCSKSQSFPLFLQFWTHISFFPSVIKSQNIFHHLCSLYWSTMLVVHLILFAIGQLCISIWFAGQLWKLISLTQQMTFKHLCPQFTLFLCPDHKHRYPLFPLFSVCCSLFLSPLLSHAHEVLQSLCLLTHTYFFPTFPLQGVSPSCFLSSSSPVPGQQPPLWIPSLFLTFSFSSLVLLHPY